jgi:hypothetical protein
VCRNTHLPAREDGTECSETSAYKLQTPGNYPKESIQHLEHGESLKLRTPYVSLQAALLATVHNLSPLSVFPVSKFYLNTLKKSVGDTLYLLNSIYLYASVKA